MRRHQGLSGLAIGCGCLGLFAVFGAVGVLYLSATGVERLEEGGPATSAPAGIQMAVQPEALSEVDGEWTAIVRLEQRDEWSWESCEVQGVRLLAGGGSIEARWVNGPFEPPLPDTLQLVFQWEGPAEPGADARLRFEIDVRASRHRGMSNGSSSRSFNLALKDFQAREVFHSGGGEEH